MFSLLQASEGDKVDFWLLTDDPFDIARFARRRAEPALGLKLFVSSPEDTILMKLRWAKLSGEARNISMMRCVSMKSSSAGWI